jgi:DNA polymerase III sliding clamp (beta) subunit (PCNA family)
VNGRQLKKLAAVAQKVADTRGNLPSLSKMYVRNGQFFITDLDNYLTINPGEDIDLAVDTTPSVDTVGFKAFATKVSVKDEIEINVDDTSITLHKGNVSKTWVSDGSDYNIPADVTEDFSVGNPILIDEADTVRDTLKRLDPFVARDDYRPALNGYYLDRANHNWIATNGHVMGIIPTCGVCGEIDEDEPAVIINPDIRKILDKIKPEGNITFYYGPEGRSGGNIVHHLIITCTDSEGWEYSLTTLLIDGPYPPYQKVIPDANKYRAEFILPLQAMNNLARFMPDGSSQSKMCRFCFDNPRFESTNYEGPVTTVQVDTEIEEIGEGLEEDETVGFNPQLLGKAVGNFFENNPLFHYIDKTMPAVLTDDTDESLALIMPVKLPGE